MRPLIQLLFALIISLGLQKAGAQWTVLHSPETQSLRGVYFADSSNGWVSGIEGIYHTTDAGGSWETQFHGVVVELAGISKEICWALYQGDTVLRTTNAGQDWEKLSLRSFLPDSAYWIINICFIDSLHGWISTYHNPPPACMLRTHDGGFTWERIATPLGFDYHDVSFTDSLNGWIVDMATDVYRTRDGGVTWDTLGYFGYARVMNIQFTDTLHGWMGMDSPGLSTTLKRTTDGGRTWLFKDTVFECSDYARVFFVDSVTGWTVYSSCVEGPGVVIHSIDGGVSWFRQYGFPSTSNFIGNKMYFTDKNHGWIAGEWGLVLHTSNGGVTDVKEKKPRAFMGPASLGQNYPEPFNSTTRLEYLVPADAHVTLKVFNLLGEEITTLVDGREHVGRKTVTFDGSRYPSGLYICRLQVDGSSTGSGRTYSSIRKIILMK